MASTGGLPLGNSMMFDYSRMEFNPSVEGDLKKVYPKLEKIMKGVSDKVARYIILMYDKNSPLRDFYRDLNKRKQGACEQAGIKYDSELGEAVRTFRKERKTQRKTKDGDYVDGKTFIEPDEDMLNAITEFLIYQNDRVWVMIITNENAFYEYQKKIMAEVGGEIDKDQLTAVNTKTKIMEAMDAIHNRLEGYYRQMSGDDKDIETALVRRRLTPESQA